MYDEIRNQILTAEIPPGTPLSEYDLASDIGVSRTPVREALMDLAAAGLIRVIPRHGIFVAEMSAQDIHEVYELRIALESLAARIAARTITPSDVNAMRRDLDEEAAAVEAGDFESAFQSGAKLHQRLQGTARNGRLQTLLRNLHDQSALIRHKAGGSGDRPALTLAEHRRLVDAIAARDPGAAEDAMRAHLEAARDNALHLVAPRGHE